MKISKAKLLSGIILGVIGLLFSIFSGITLIERGKIVYAEAPATICVIDEYYDMLAHGLEGETMHKVYVDYTVDGQDYENVEYGSYDPAMKEGDVVTVKYKVDDPADISAPASLKVPFIVLGTGIVLLAAGLILVLAAVKAKNAQQK